MKITDLKALKLYLIIIISLVLIIPNIFAVEGVHGVVIGQGSGSTIVQIYNATLLNILVNASGEQAQPGHCAFGFVVMNTTNDSSGPSGGVQCVPVVDLETDPVWVSVRNLYNRTSELLNQFVPYNGSTQDVYLGDHNINASNVTSMGVIWARYAITTPGGVYANEYSDTTGGEPMMQWINTNHYWRMYNNWFAIDPMNITLNASNSWYNGLFNWVVSSNSQNYLSFDGHNLSLNETHLNETISLLINDSSDDIWANLSDEILARIANDSHIMNNLSAEVGGRIGNDTVLMNNLTAEVGGRIGNDTDLMINLTAEILGRIANDTALMNNITAEVGGRIGNDTELINALASNISGEVFARIANDTNLMNNLTAEVLGRIGNDSTLQGNITGEQNARIGNDTEIRVDVASINNSKASIGICANGQVVNQTTFTGVVCTAVTLLSDLLGVQNNLTYEINARIANDTLIWNNLSAETSARIANDTALGIREPNIAMRNESNNFGYNNLTTSGYFEGQPLNGMLGSGVIWVNNTNQFAETNVTCTGLNCAYTAFKVRLVNTTNNVTYCDIPAGIMTVPDNTHSVYYVDKTCTIQNTDMNTYIETSISPGGIADFANIIAVSGDTYNPNGIGLENKRIIKLRKLLLETMHLNIINGFNRNTGVWPMFNISSGSFVYLMDIVDTVFQKTSVDYIEGVYHSAPGVWDESDYSGLNVTECETGIGHAACTNTNKYRRIFIFDIGYNDSQVDNTQLHQLLPSQTIYYNTPAECLDTGTNPLTYTLPSYYQYGAVMLYAYCARPADTVWTTNFIDLRTVKQSTATGAVDMSAYVRKTGDSMSGPLNMTNNNISLIDTSTTRNVNWINNSFITRVTSFFNETSHCLQYNGLTSTLNIC